MSPTPPDLILGLLAGATAIGLSPYAALAAAGLAHYIGFAALPGNLSGLATPGVWITLAALALLDATLSHYRLSDLVWNALHTIIRPLAAVLYASAALADSSFTLQWAVALAALPPALLVHLWILATRTAARTAGPIAWLPGFTALRLLGAALLAGLALRAPPYAAALAAVLVLAPLPSLTRLWGAASLALRATLTALIRPDRLHRWDGAALRPRLRRAVEAELDGPIGAARSAPVTLARHGPRWVYRPGRLVLAHGKPAVLVYRRGFAAAVVRLPYGAGKADGGVLIETLEVAGRRPYALCVGPSAPTGPAIMAELKRRAPQDGEPLELRPPGAV